MAFINPKHPIAKLVREDRRYPLEAYLFVFEALRFAQDELGMGSEVQGEGEEAAEPETPRAKQRTGKAHRHLSGQELCEAIRRFALDQYGLMAKCVLNQWGIHGTGDFGEIVFNLIRIKEMRKTRTDRREDFNDVYNFDEGLTGQFRITMPEAE